MAWPTDIAVTPAKYQKMFKDRNDELHEWFRTRYPEPSAYNLGDLVEALASPRVGQQKLDKKDIKIWRAIIKFHFRRFPDDKVDLENAIVRALGERKPRRIELKVNDSNRWQKPIIDLSDPDKITIELRTPRVPI